MKRNNLAEIAAIGLLLVLASLLGSMLDVEITGYTVYEGNTYIDDINLTFESNTNYLWVPETYGELSSVKISGYLEGDSAFISLVDDLIYSYSALENEAIVVENGSGELSIEFNYGTGIGFDNNNDGIEHIGGVIDYDIQTHFNLAIDQSKLCTRYIIENLDEGLGEVICHGNSECCSFLNLNVENNDWDSNLYLNYEKYGAGYDNKVSAQAVYYDVDLSVPYSNIYNSEIKQLNAIFNDRVYFNLECSETCELPLYEDEDYRLDISVDGLVHIDNITYTLGSEAVREQTSQNDNATLTVYDSVDNGITGYRALNVEIYAEFNVNSTNASITGATCNITYSDGNFSSMNYSVGSSRYYDVKNFSEAKAYTYNVSCYHTDYNRLNETGSIDIILPEFSFVDSGNSFIGGEDSSLAFADYDGDGLWDLIIGAENGAVATKFYQNQNNGSMFEDTSQIVSGIETGSISFGDLDRDGLLDLVLTGYDGTTQVAAIYLNNGTGFNNTYNLTGISYSSTHLFDYDNDGDLDLGYSGTTNNGDSGKDAKLFYNNNSNFSTNTQLNSLFQCSISLADFFGENNVLLSGLNSMTGTSYLYNHTLGALTAPTGLYRSSQTIGDIDNDGDLDMIISGRTSSLGGQYKTIAYVNNGISLNSNQELEGVYWGSSALGDMNQDGIMDLVVTGYNGSASVINFYINNGTNFTYNGSYGLDTIYKSSVALFDYDNDGDLDLGYSGNTGSKVAFLYNNNVSLIQNNTAPSSPTEFSTTFNGVTFDVSWGNGSDDLTPELGLYYNLRIGTTPGGNDIVSGKYGGNSNPTQGYIGNMQQRKNTSINLSINRTYFWQVQSIDNGLKPGSWSVMQEHDSCPSLTSVNLYCYKYQKSISENDLNVFSNTLVLRDVNITTNNLNVNSDAIINETRFTGNITVNGSLNMYDTNVIGTVIFSNSYENNLTNSNFSGYSVSNASFYKRWRVTIITNETSVGASVNVKDKNDNVEADGLTSDGQIALEVINFVYNDTGVESMNNHTFTISASGYNTQTIRRNISDNLVIYVNLTESQVPTYDNFSSNFTTNFTNVSNLNNVENATIGVVDKGVINFSNSIDIAGLNLDDVVKISDNSIFVDADNAPGLNVNATLTFFNISQYYYEPVPMKNDAVCDTCTFVSYSNVTKELVYNVTGFSTYSSNPNSNLVVTSSNRINNKPLADQLIFISANYTNTSSGGAINSANVNCTIDFDGAYENMTYNTTSLVYEFNRTFTSTGTFYFNVSCVNDLGYEELNVSTSLTIFEDKITFSLNQSLSGFVKSSVVLGDINNDDEQDMIIIGENNTDSSAAFIYYYDSSAFVLNNSDGISGLEVGSLVLIDYNNDGILDLVEIGRDSDGLAAYKFYKNS